MTRLRILHVAAFCGEAWAYGGIARVVGTLTQELARRGHDVTLIATDAKDAGSRLEPGAAAQSRDVTLQLFPNLSNRLAYHLQLFLPLGLKRYLELQARHFDIAHLHGCHHLPGALAAKVLRQAGVPYVLTPHGTAPLIERRRASKWLFRFLFERHLLTGSRRVLVSTKSERAQLSKLTGERVPLALVPNPLLPVESCEDESGVSFRKKWKLESPLVGYLGKLTPRKGLDVLLRAMTLLPHETRLFIAGNDMGEERRLRRLASELGLGGRVVFTGLLVGPERLEALRAADVVAYPSRDEAFGLVPLEAIQVGRPVVVGDDSGCGEIIASLGGGELVPPGDSTRLARALQHVLASPGLWQERLRVARARVLERFAPARVCEQLETEYAAVMHAT